MGISGFSIEFPMNEMINMGRQNQQGNILPMLIIFLEMINMGRQSQQGKVLPMLIIFLYMINRGRQGQQEKESSPVNHFPIISKTSTVGHFFFGLGRLHFRSFEGLQRVTYPPAPISILMIKGFLVVKKSQNLLSWNALINKKEMGSGQVIVK